MSIYRELHLDSAQNGRTSGSISKPEWQFTEPVYIKKFCVKHVSVPLSFPNIYQPSQVFLNLQRNGGPVQSAILEVPVGLYSAQTFVEILNTELQEWSQTNGSLHNFFLQADIFTDDISSEQYVILSQEQVDGKPVSTDEVKFRFSRITDEYPFENFSILQRFLGYGTDKSDDVELLPALGIWVDLPLPSEVERHELITGATKFSLPNYIMMRSTLGSGSRFCPHIRGRAYDKNGYQQGGYNSSDIIAKVPIQAELVENGTQFSHRNLNFDATLMHEYNGEQLDKMSIFFTYPNSEQVIDFGVFNFSVTIAFLADRI